MKYLVALLVLFALQFAPGVGVGDAVAAMPSQCQNYNHSTAECTRAYAYTLAGMAADETSKTGFCSTRGGRAPNRIDYKATTPDPSYRGYYMCNNGTAYDSGVNYFWLAANECPAGSTWNDVAKTCHDPAQCLAKEPLPASYTDSIVSVACSAGCEFAPASGNIVSVQVGNSAPTTALSGWVPTGNACAAGDVAPTPMSDEQACFDPGDGQTFCMKADGRQCYKAVRNGRQICWRPGEVGEKADGPVLQKRNAGATPLPPTTPPPPGDAFQQSGTPQVAQTTSGGSVFNTTTTNYQTSGIDAVPGGSDDGEPADGSGSGEGGGEGEGGGVAGGGDCSAPPVVAPGTDTLSAFFVQSLWLERCEGMAGQGANVDAAIADGQAAVDAASDALNNYINDPFDMRSDPGMGGVAEDVAGAETTGTDMLDSSGWLGASQCPTFPPIPVGNAEITLGIGPLCEVMVNFGSLVLAFAYFIAARIIAIT